MLHFKIFTGIQSNKDLVFFSFVIYLYFASRSSLHLFFYFFFLPLLVFFSLNWWVFLFKTHDNNQ